MLGGPIIAGPTLSRFFALHVFVIPGILLALVGLQSGWCCGSASTNGPCPAGSSARKPTCRSTTS